MEVLGHHVCNIKMCIDVIRPPFISCATLLHKMECNCVRLLIERQFRHFGVSQHIMVVTIHVFGILDWNYHHYEIVKNTMDILTGLLHFNQITTIRTGLVRFLIL